MTGSALALRTIDDVERVSNAYAQSGYWPDAKNQAQAFVKVSFGIEAGLPAYVAMSEVHIIQGKPTLGAGALAALVKGHPNYDYRVVEHTEQVCAIEFYATATGESLGVSRFSLDDARTAGLLGNPTWKKYPRNMLFARAISNGVAWFAPDVTMGRVYTPDEMADVVDAEVIEDSGSEPRGEPVRAAAAGAQAPVAGKTADAPASDPDTTPPDPTEPADLAIAAHCSRLEAELLMLSGQLDVDRHLVETMIAARQAEHDGDPEALRAWLERQVEQAHKSLEAQQEPSFEPPKGERGQPQLATKGMQTKVIIAAKEAGLDDDARHALLERVVGNPSTKQLLRKDVQKVLDAIEAVAVPF